MMKKTKKVRTCQNMSGILGGANAFNFLSFVAGVITLRKKDKIKCSEFESPSFLLTLGSIACSISECVLVLC